MNWFSVSDVEWTVRTDKTERPAIGKSTLEVSVGDSVHATGLLYALPGRKGPVGFALIEAPVPADASRHGEICFDFSAEPVGLHFQALLKDEQADQPQGTLTFQRDFLVTAPGRQRWSFPLSEFRATIRGTPVSGFALQRQSIRAFSLQITRSSQQPPFLAQSPLPFAFSLAGEVRFR